MEEKTKLTTTLNEARKLQPRGNGPTRLQQSVSVSLGDIAKIYYAARKAYCETVLGITPWPAWQDATAKDREATLELVQGLVDGEEAEGAKLRDETDLVEGVFDDLHGLAAQIIDNFLRYNTAAEDGEDDEDGESGETDD